MKRYILVLFLIFLFSCNLLIQPSSEEPQKVVVYGKIVNQTSETPKVISILACDPLSDDDRYASRIDSTGIFRAEFEMLWGHSFTVNYDRQFINLFAIPGDSIYLEIDASKFHERENNSLLFGGDNAQKNMEFSQTFNDLVGIINPVFNDFTLPLNEFMDLFEGYSNQINDSIVNYCSTNDMSQWTMKLMQDMSLYILANAAMDYQGQKSEDALEFFTHPVFDIYNPENFNNMMFSYHVSAYGATIYGNDSLVPVYAKNNDFINLEKHVGSLLLALPKSLTRDLLLHSFYKKIKGGTLEINAEWFTDKFIYQKVLTLREANKAIELPQLDVTEGALYYSKEGTIESIQNFNLGTIINEEYKDKVIYLDIWASWCGPCIAEMPPAREVHKLFHDKDVVFMNICMDSSLESWEKMVRKGDIEGENYFFDHDLSAIAAASFLSGGFPTYILIGKDAKIRTREAPRPSSITQLCEAIDKLLAE